MKIHELKCWPRYFQAVKSGRKTFDIRIDDNHGFASGDILRLKEWNPGIGRFVRGIPCGDYTGETCDVVAMWSCTFDDLADLFPQLLHLDNCENMAIMSIKLKNKEQS